MEALLFSTLDSVSLVIGVIAIMIIIVGVARASFEYVRHCWHFRLPHIRGTLDSHLILALDFLIGKDIIDTFIINSDVLSWPQLATLAMTVTIRIVMSFFLERELEGLKEDHQD